MAPVPPAGNLTKIRATGYDWAMPASRVAAWAVPLVAVFALLAARTADAQERVVLRAMVVDSLARPVAQANVRTSPPAHLAVTDSAGRFSFTLEPRARVSLIISLLGFQAETVHVAFAGRAVVDSVIAIRRRVVVLPTVLVETDVPERYRGISRYEDFYERRRMAIGGKFFDRDQLDQLGSTAWALNSVPGVRATEFNGRVSAQFSRCPSGKVAVIIDGIYLPTLGIGDIRSNEVETLEVYTGVAQIPAVARGDACAAVIVTTRMARDSR